MLVLLAATLGPLLQGCRAASHGQSPIVVGIGNSTEQTVLGEISLLVLQRAGFRVTARRGLGDAWSVRRALEGGRADLVWDYTGRTWQEVLGHDQPIADAADLYRRVRDQDALNGFSWVDYAPAESRWVMAAPESWAAQARVRSLSDLAYHMQNLNPDLVLCTTAEIAASQYGPTALARVYRAQFKTPNVRQMTAPEAIAGLGDGSCHCALVPANEIPAAVLDLRRLWDDKGLMPASSLAPVVRSFVLHNDPGLTPYLRRLAASLDQDRLAQLVAEVNGGKSPARVARQFMRSIDVVSTPTPTHTPTPTPTHTVTPASQ